MSELQKGLLPRKAVVRTLFTWRPLAVLVFAATACGGVETSVAADRSFPLVEATIDQVWGAMDKGELSCHELVQGYLDRIAAYDHDPSPEFPASPGLHSVIATNPSALADADALDAAFARSKQRSGPLHCVTVMVKDNIDVAGMPTTGGSVVLENSRPPVDAFIVSKLRNAGAIILGKANMDEWAFGYVGKSAMGGQVRNAYDTGKSPGGSSSGTGTAIASNLAMVGIGTDTGGSGRVPAAVAGLIGLRPSLQLVSQAGILPLAHGQDTAAPMCRTVADCARLLDVLVGYDSNPASGQRRARSESAALVSGASEYSAVTGVPVNYHDALAGATLAGVRIGVVRDLYPRGIGATMFRSRLDGALARMTALGATVEDVSIADLNKIKLYQSLSLFEFRQNLTDYLQSWSSDADGHPRTAGEVNGLMQLQEPFQTASLMFSAYMVGGLTSPLDPLYKKNLDERDAFVIPRVLAALNNTNLAGHAEGAPYDVLVYPIMSNVNRAAAGASAEANGKAPYLSPFTGFPELSMPVAYIKDVGHSNVDQPAALELLGRPFDERTLLRVAQAWEQFALVRQAPQATPELSRP